MDADILNQVMNESLEDYAKTKAQIRQCLPAFEKICSHLIEKIASGSQADAEGEFDQLLQLQGTLSKAVFVHEIDVGKRLMAVVKEFERLHDSNTREYWFKQFKAGITWPTPPGPPTL